MAHRKAVTKAMTERYRRASKTEKGRMLFELCALRTASLNWPHFKRRVMI